MADKPKYVAVSFSGGKDSTAMLLHMIELGEHIDEVLNVDVGMEFPVMYDHIAIVRDIVEDAGIKYVTLKSDHSFEWYLLEKPVPSKKYGEHKGYGWPSVKCRWCTRHLKLDLLDKHLKELRRDFNLVQCIGLACDEVRRLQRPNNTKKDQRHPLVEWGWSENDALEYCKSKGFDWGGLYNIFSRVSCWCCPFSGINELRNLWKHYPNLWQQLLRWEEELSKPGRGQKFRFKEKVSVFDLNDRFEYEQSRLDRGLSIDTEGFYQNLRRIIAPKDEKQTTIEVFE